MKPRILLFGSKGQLGAQLVRVLSPEHDLIALSREDIDLRDRDAVRSAVRSAKPQIILNAAAYTAVDRAESEPDAAFAVNAAAPAAMAHEALQLNAWLLHFSTDYVFNGSGNTPWREADVPQPLNVYGQSKLAGEQGIAASGCRHLIFRTSWVYGAQGNNFLRTMLRLGAERPSLKIVNDQVGAPTTTNELARATVRIMDEIDRAEGAAMEQGIYHMTCGGSTSWFGFASAIFERVRDRVSIPSLTPIPSAEYVTPAVRPHNSILNCDKLERAAGIRLASWETALDEAISEL